MFHSKQRIFGLDLVRATAILLVLISHTFGISLVSKSLSTNIFCCGVIGVELFFVLSGFLIGTILIKTYNQSSPTKLGTIKTFLIRRWFRTLPNYYLVIVFYNLFYYKSYGGLIFSGHSNFNYLFFFQNFFSEMSDHVFPVSWSLAIEEWFYILFPIFLFMIQFLLKSKSKSVLILIISFITIPILLKLFFSLSNSPITWDNGYRKIVLFRLDSIGWGVLLAYLNHYHQTILNQYRKLFCLIGVILGGLTLCITHSYLYKNLFIDVFLLPMFSLSTFLMLPALISINSQNINSLVKKIVEFISLTSYSVYLLHMLVISVIQLLLLKFNVTDNAFIKITIIWMVIFAISYLQYRFFEVKMTSIRDRFTQKTNKVMSLQS